MGDTEHTRVLTEEEFGRVFTKCRPLFIRVANSYIHDSDVAEDITDDSFIRMWEKRDEILTDNYEAYVFKAVVNRCLDYLKIQQARLRIQQDIHATGNRMQMYEINSLKSLNPDRIYADEIMGIIKESLGKMPSLTRQVFLASRVEEKTYSEISDSLGIPVRQVTSHIQLALKSLRVSLKDYLPSVVITLLLSTHGILSAVGGKNWPDSAENAFKGLYGHTPPIKSKSRNSPVLAQGILLMARTVAEGRMKKNGYTQNYPCCNLQQG